MSLRKQLALFSLLSFVLPWAGYQYVVEMEGVLRTGLEQSIRERADTIAGAIERQGLTTTLDRATATRIGGENSADSAATVYARLLATAPRIDGSRDDWNLPIEEATTPAVGIQQWVGAYGPFLYVVAEINDEHIVYPRVPGQAPFGDRAIVQLADTSGATDWLLFSTSAPGTLRAQRTAPPQFAASEDYDDRVIAAWRELAMGYSIEMRLPLSVIASGFNFGVIDVDPQSPGNSANEFAAELKANWYAPNVPPARVVVQSASLTAALEQYSDDNHRYHILDSDGWIIASAGQTNSVGASLSDDRGLIELLIRAILQTDDPPYRDLQLAPGRMAPPQQTGNEVQFGVDWYRGDFENDAVVVSAVPLLRNGRTVGTLLLEQTSDAILTATNQALMRLVGLTFGVSLIAMIGMLAFATWLSLRVSRLARATESALGPKGEIATALPEQAARDEIGGLARSFSALLGRLREYTRYLRTLTSKLSHELRTPLAVVSTSLDNLEKNPDPHETQQYIRRMRSGVDRLDAILVAMSEATHIEQAISDTARGPFDLVAVTSSCAASYADVYPARKFAFSCAPAEGHIIGSEDLLAQLLDKLVDNAVSFSPVDSLIVLAVTREANEFHIAVSNEGSKLPDTMQDQLFDSLVSLREHRGDRPHLGLGLYIAALIARFHGGRISASNRNDLDGVVVTVSLPRSPS